MNRWLASPRFFVPTLSQRRSLCCFPPSSLRFAKREVRDCIFAENSHAAGLQKEIESPAKIVREKRIKSGPAEKREMGRPYS